jgi:hypothetical protein
MNHEHRHEDRSQRQPGLEQEENAIKNLLHTNMHAAAERLRNDADNFPMFNQMAKDLYYSKLPDDSAFVWFQPIIRRGDTSGRKVVEVSKLDGRSATEQVAMIDDLGHHKSLR